MIADPKHTIYSGYSGKVGRGMSLESNAWSAENLNV